MRRPRPNVPALRVLAVLTVLALMAAGAVSALAYGVLVAGLPDPDLLDRHQPAETTRVFSRDGRLIATLFHENRTVVPLHRVSPRVVEALVAVEDSRFFEHDGVDYRGVARAALANLQGGEVEQGASTLTMQLARAMFLTPERTWLRKAREALLAVRLEDRYSKRRILEAYLNQMYFGSGAYGIASAASTYYGQKPDRLTAAQAAFLAGLLQAPTRLSDPRHRRDAVERQVLVLQRMRELGFLTEAEHRKATREAARARVRPRPALAASMLKHPYFTSHVVAELSSRYPDEVLYRGGLRVYTTLDVGLQESAQRILERRLRHEGGSYNAHQGALALVENGTGHVRALVGGTGWSDGSQFNRATQAGRQPGSAFKPFVFATALEQGWTPASVVPDTPVTYQRGTRWQWSPRNADGRFLGPIPLRVALMKSRNVVAVKLLDRVGIRPVIETSRAMGLRGRMDPYPSLALGVCEATPLEMATAYSVFVNGGALRKPTTVKLVVDRHGQVLEDHRAPGPARPVLSAATAARMVGMLEGVVRGGTGTAAALPGYRAAGKTGTTESHRDAWFVGFTPDHTLAVWIGNDDNQPMWQAYGGDLPARIWREVMDRALAGRPARPFEALAALPMSSVALCATTGLRAGAWCPHTRQAAFPEGEEPTRGCTVHGPIPALARVPDEVAVTGLVPVPPAALVTDLDGDGVLTNADLRAAVAGGPPLRPPGLRLHGPRKAHLRDHPWHRAYRRYGR